MKKYFKLFTLVIALLLLTGCGADDTVKLVKTCRATQTDPTGNYKIESEYKVYGKNDVVEKVETIETVTSNNKDLLDTFEEQINSTYEGLNSTYGGYDYKVTNENGKVVSKTTIDYNKMNLKKFVEDNTSMKEYVNSDSKILVKGIEKIYQALGAVCE